MRDDKPLPGDRPVPVVGETYYDYSGRKFEVTKVDHKEQVVRGMTAHRVQEPRKYACTFRNWEDIWNNKTPPLPSGKQKYP